jgi:multiple sugar transport system ATP-binding protein
MARVQLDKVSKVFPGGTTAVDGVTLDVADGEFVVLVGPSGCGKSTVLRIVAGLEEATSGTVSIDGEVVNDLSPASRDVAMVFQNYALYPHMTVAQNLSFSLRLRHRSKQDIRTEVDETARVLGLEQLLGRKPAALSGGQRQRVAMGRAIIRQPQLFLMDEPLSNLDAKLRVAMRAELSRLHQRYGTTTLYVTHDQIEAMTLGDRIAVLDHGRLQQVGTPQELYQHPCNVFVAGFIGSPAMNLANGRLVATDGGLDLVAGQLRWPLPPVLAGDPALRAYADRKVVFGVRPHAFALAGPGTPADAAHLRVQAATVESLGSEHNVLFTPPFPTVEQNDSVDDGELETSQLWTAQLGPDDTVAGGQPVDLVVDLAQAYFFDAESTAAIALSPRVLVGSG